LPRVREASNPLREPADDESELLDGLRAGRDEAYHELVRRHGGRLLAVARRIVRSEDEALDTLQDALLQAFRNLDGFASQSRLSTWLHRITVNAALMRIRRRKSRPEEPIEPVLPTFLEDGHATVEFGDWGESPEALLAREEVRSTVRSAIDRLPGSYRTVLVLRDIEELDTAEVAAELGISPNAVKIRLHRARQALRTMLDRRFLGSEP
jgi:RNA polymerase sigma-70 factor (ECF subfamily)